MKMLNLKKLFLLLALFVGISQTAAAAPLQCKELFITSLSAPQKKLAQVRRFQKVEFSDSEKEAVKAIVNPHGIDRVLNHLDVIEKLASKIASEEGDAVAKAEKLAVVGQKIQAVLEIRLKEFYRKLGLEYSEEFKYKLTNETLTERLKKRFPRSSDDKIKAKVIEAQAEFKQIKEQLFKARYTLGENIAKLEAFKISEFEYIDSHALNNPGYTLVTLSEYPKFAMSLATNTAPPKPYGTGGVVSLREYRDVVSNNLWLFTLQGHDLKHIHFANSHPLAGASLFRVTRSKNSLRYFLTAAIYEGVDTIQYAFERAITSSFDRRGYTLEQGMIFLVSATQEQLLTVAREIGVNPETDYYLADFKTWKPRTLKPELMPAGYKGPESLESDIVSFISKSLNDLEDPNINYFMRPELLPEGVAAPAGINMKPGENLHYR